MLARPIKTATSWERLLQRFIEKVWEGKKMKKIQEMVFSQEKEGSPFFADLGGEKRNGEYPRIIRITWKGSGGERLYPKGNEP